MEKEIDVTKAEDVVKKITELVGGLNDGEELYIEIEVRAVERKEDK